MEFLRFHLEAHALRSRLEIDIRAGSMSVMPRIFAHLAPISGDEVRPTAKIVEAGMHIEALKDKRRLRLPRCLNARHAKTCGLGIIG